jgi:hypothetical protein
VISLSQESEKGYVLVDVDRDLIPFPQELEARGVVEQQLLQVKHYRFASATTRVPTEDGERVDSHLSLTLTGDPGERSKVTTAVLVFITDGEELRVPTYDPEIQRMLIEFPLSRLRSIEETLARVDQVFCLFQELSSGQVWADLHTKLEAVGAG